MDTAYATPPDYGVPATVWEVDDSDPKMLRVRQVPVATLSEGEVEVWCAAHPPRQQYTVEEFVREGEREVCVPVAGGLFWQHFHHITVPNVIRREWVVRRWLLPDGRVAGRRDDPADVPPREARDE